MCEAGVLDIGGHLLTSILLHFTHTAAVYIIPTTDKPVQ